VASLRREKSALSILKTKKLNVLQLLLATTYFVSYVTRLNYSAMMVEIISVTGFTKADAALPLTGMAVAYGLGQLLSGYAGDKIQPKWIIGVGLLITACMNACIPICQSPWQMVIVWSMNGLAQAFMWPPIIKLMSELFDYEEYNKGCIAVNYGGYLGQIALYLMVPVCLRLSGWKTVFLVAALSAILMMLVWFWKCPLISMAKQQKTTHTPEKPMFPWSLMLISIFCAIILMGALRDGVSAWMPTLISDNFGLSNSASILTGVILPVFAILSICCVSYIRQRWVKNELKFSAILFAVCALCAALNGFIEEKNVAITVVLLGLLVGCMNGVNLLLISFIPRYYVKFGCVSLVSGALNSCTYIGAAFSTYAIALVSENHGWTPTLFLWVAIALCGGLLCVFQVKRWSQFIGLR